MMDDRIEITSQGEEERCIVRLWGRGALAGNCLWMTREEAVHLWRRLGTVLQPHDEDVCPERWNSGTDRMRPAPNA